MTEETKTPKTEAKPAKKEKPPALEEKPFPEFIEQHFVPTLKTALNKAGISDIDLNFTQAPLQITGMSQSPSYSQVIGQWNNGQRQFNLYFIDEDIKGQKAFSYTVKGQPPSTLESFMIDEKRVTLDLMVLYVLQRLNGQKWLTGN